MRTLRNIGLASAIMMLAACDKENTFPSVDTTTTACDLPATDDEVHAGDNEANAAVDFGNDSIYDGLDGAGQLKAGGIVLTPQTLFRWCPQQVAGDKEFDGHGPWSHAYVQLYISGGNKLRAHIYYRVRETQSNWSEAVLNQYVTLFTAPPGQSITSINSDTYCQYIYTDTNHATRTVFFSGQVASKFVLNGDTGGNDIGNCTSDDAYLSVYWNPINITLN